jgi:hypothetical protein
MRWSEMPLSTKLYFYGKNPSLASCGASRKDAKLAKTQSAFAGFASFLLCVKTESRNFPFLSS